MPVFLPYDHLDMAQPAEHGRENEHKMVSALPVSSSANAKRSYNGMSHHQKPNRWIMPTCSPIKHLKSSDKKRAGGISYTSPPPAGYHRKDHQTQPSCQSGSPQKMCRNPQKAAVCLSCRYCNARRVVPHRQPANIRILKACVKPTFFVTTSIPGKK